MTTQKSLSGDFGGNINTSNLFTDIVNSSINKVLLEIQVIGDDVNIIFNSSLSGSEETLLNNLITNHSSIVRNNIYTFPSINHIYSPCLDLKKTTVPNILSYTNYKGSKDVGDPNNEGFVVYKGKINFVLRDITGSDIFNFTTEGDPEKPIPYSMDIPELQNLPYDKTILQLSYSLLSDKGKLYSINIQ